MALYDYRCPKGHWFEATKGREERFVRCPEHGLRSKRADVSGIPGANTPTVGFKPSKEIAR